QVIVERVLSASQVSFFLIVSLLVRFVLIALIGLFGLLGLLFLWLEFAGYFFVSFLIFFHSFLYVITLESGFFS
ncbi:MAG: hypothetical protein ACK521_11070, partial [bacterium]